MARDFLSIFTSPQHNREEEEVVIVELVIADRIYWICLGQLLHQNDPKKNNNKYSPCFMIFANKHLTNKSKTEQKRKHTQDLVFKHA